MPGDGRYLVQPVYVGDVAELCIELAGEAGSRVVDACGPEVFAFNDLVRTVGAATGARRPLIHLPATLVLAVTRVIGLFVRDVVLTRDEIRELSEGLLTSPDPPTTSTRFSDWIAAHGADVGRRYESELGRNFRISARAGPRR